MPFVTSLGRALSTAILFFSLANAQTTQCYYPDGSPSDDVPCANAADASCCGANSWCMDNGLCFKGGLVTRGSCTDITWQSDACTSFCTKSESRTHLRYSTTLTIPASPSTSIAITPCTADGSFSCGLGTCQNSTGLFSMSGSGSFVLRASQVEALVAPALAAAEAAASATTSAASNPGAVYTAGQLAGVGCGVGVPLLFAILTIIFLLNSRRRLAQQYPPPSSPDPRTDIRLQPPMRRFTQQSSRSLRELARNTSTRGSSQYARSSTSSQPEHLKAWSERYRVINEKTRPSVRVQEIRVELDASSEIRPRYELGTPAQTQTPI